jgi:hypothetical protein
MQLYVSFWARLGHRLAYRSFRLHGPRCWLYPTPGIFHAAIRVEARRETNDVAGQGQCENRRSAFGRNLGYLPLTIDKRRGLDNLALL